MSGLVYVLKTGNHRIGSHILGLYSTLDKAMIAMRNYMSEGDGEWIERSDKGVVFMECGECFVTIAPWGVY